MIDFNKPRSEASRAAAEKAKLAREDGDAIKIGEIRLSGGGRDDDRASSRVRKINDIAGVFLVIVIGLAPIPIASARPIYWAIWTVILGLALAVYALAVQLLDPTRKLNSLALWPVILPGLALPVIGLIQVAIAGLGFESTFAGETIPLGTMTPGATMVAVIRLAGFFALFVLASEVASRARRVEAIAWGLFGAVFLHAIWALVALAFLNDYVFWGEKVSYLGSATGTFINRNSFATFLGFGLVIGVALTLNLARRPRVRHPRGRHLLSERNIELAVLWLMVLIVAAALIATQSRMGVTSSTVAVIFVFVVMSVKGERGRFGNLALSVGFVFIAVAAAVGLFGSGLLERGLFSINNSTTRTDLYAQVAEIIRARPFLGTGLDSFAPAFELIHHPPVSSAFVWRHTHSTYLDLWSEMGLIVGSLPMLAVLIAAWKLVGLIRRRDHNFAVPTAALGAIVLGALHSTIDFSLEIQADTMIFVTLVALGLGRLRRKNKDG